MRKTVIELGKEDMKFSAGHFTIFSATRRERLHGHNFRISGRFDCYMGDDGLTFDYGVYKRVLTGLCRDWNEYFLLPQNSPHLRFEEDDNYLYALFNGERIPFLRADVLVLPVANVTVEALAELMVRRLDDALRPGDRPLITTLTVSVFSGPGQSASSTLALQERV
jgi:6-pyruvoyltetrahydropterin/6-carboxytetrahydropterin synthase